jgi:hypothetical protein
MPLLKLSLILAGLYNLAFGTWVILFPDHFWLLLQMPAPNYPMLWQCLGMIVGVYGIGYLIAARDPIRHWPIILVGLLGKILGPLGFLNAATHGALPWRFGIVNIFNDLIWWLPFTLLLLAAWKHRSRL